MPHLLVAGRRPGKSVAVNAMILSLLYKSEPREVRVILIGPRCSSCRCTRAFRICSRRW